MEEKYIKHTVTQEDIDMNPGAGLNLGEEIGIPMSALIRSFGKDGAQSN